MFNIFCTTLVEHANGNCCCWVMAFAVLPHYIRRSFCSPGGGDGWGAAQKEIEMEARDDEFHTLIMRPHRRRHPIKTVNRLFDTKCLIVSAVSANQTTTVPLVSAHRFADKNNANLVTRRCFVERLLFDLFPDFSYPNYRLT